MKRGKYVGATFTADQIKARAMWQRALKYRVSLSETLMCAPDGHDREYWHKRLDWQLDHIEELRAEALRLFPEVDESFVVASMTIWM